MNKAKCRNCKQIIQSKHVHDMVACRCYLETKALSEAFREKIVENIELDDRTLHLLLCYFNAVVGRGFFLDGGDDYQRAGGNLTDIIYLDE